jgi:hypothetical protein
VLSEELLQQLVSAFRAGQTRPGNGAAVFQQLLGALHRAGISPSIPAEMGPQLGPQSGAPIGAVPLGPQAGASDPGVTLQQLRDAMRRAGLLTAKQVAAATRNRRPPGGSSQSSANGPASSAGNSDAAQSRQLTEAMRQSGLI